MNEYNQTHDSTPNFPSGSTLLPLHLRLPPQAAPFTPANAGAALLTTLATAWGPQPAMTVDAIGVGAGGRDPEGHANVVRLFRGSRQASSLPQPRRGAAAAGVQRRRPRPPGLAGGDRGPARGRRVRRLADPDPDEEGPPGAHPERPGRRRRARRAVRAAIFRQTSTIGLREQPLTKHALDREIVAVEVDGQPIAVKLARHEGVVVNAQPEYDDVARAATALGRPVNDVLAEAAALSRAFLTVTWTPDGPGRRRPDLPRHLRRRAARTRPSSRPWCWPPATGRCWCGSASASPSPCRRCVAVLLGHAVSFLPEEVVQAVAGADVPGRAR